MGAKRRTSVLLDEALLRKARKVLNASSNTEAIARALEETLLNKEVEVSLRDLLREGRGRFVDVYRQERVPILLDTGVYLVALRSAAGAAQFERLFRPVIFRTYLSSVVVEELYAGALDSIAVRLVERHVGALERTGRIIAPTFEDWKEAGKLIAGITRKERGQKPRVQRMLNDILLALSARRLGAELFTFNRDDFELIRRHRPFALRVLRADYT